MKKIVISTLFTFISIVLLLSSFTSRQPSSYIRDYAGRLAGFRHAQSTLLDVINNCRELTPSNIKLIQAEIRKSRLRLKEIDFWIRYFEPIAYKKINGPLPVEWETEVFEKWEAPYRREGGGLTLAALYLDEKDPDLDSLKKLIEISIAAAEVYSADSITRNLFDYHHFFLSNRLFLLNLAAIYTTGYECPDRSDILPELKHMLESVKQLYQEYNTNFPEQAFRAEYLERYTSMIRFVNNQGKDIEGFDHFLFIRDHLNPLYRINHEMILDYNVRTKNFNDFSINKQAASIFDKDLYRGQNKKGIYIGVTDGLLMKQLIHVGGLLFNDPILSGNNKRSCASCHKPSEFFTDTTVATPLDYDGVTRLSRNTPSLINSVYNHLLMADGKHINLENQGRDVITNPREMGSNEREVIRKVLGLEEYRSVLEKSLAATPQYDEVNMEHIASAIMLYYSEMSGFYSPFDDAMNGKSMPGAEIINGFNLFMGKAQCGTCHFVPQFNGVKPPYVGSEFEVIGVPADRSFTKLSADKGRFLTNPVKEMEHAFRTSTLRNIASTKPYMHNGVFQSLQEVMDFYNAGGGTGKGLHVFNQTLSSDSLRLTKNEMSDIITFMHSLTEQTSDPYHPSGLPGSKNKTLNNRLPGGEY